MVIKLDTLGKKHWQVILEHPDKKEFQTIFTCEDIKRNGYWAFAGHANDFNPYLYFISKDGKAKLVCKITIPNNVESFFSAGSWVLQNGDLLLSYKYKKCDNDPNFIYCWGIGKVEASYLDNILPAKEAIQPSNSDNNFSISPNPIRGNFKILFSKEEEGVIMILNEIGNIAQIEKFTNKNEVEVRSDNLSSGIYFVKIQFKNGMTASNKIIILD